MPEEIMNLGRDRHYYEDLSDEIFQFFGCGDADNFKRTYYPLPELRARFKKGNCDIDYPDDGYDVITIKDENFEKPLAIVKAFNDALDKSDRVEKIKTKVNGNILQIFVPSFVDPEWRVIRPEFRKVAVENFEQCLEEFARTFDFNLLNNIETEEEAIELFKTKALEEFPKIKSKDLAKSIDIFKEEVNNIHDDIMNSIWNYDWSNENINITDEEILNIIKKENSIFPNYLKNEFISEVRDIIDDLNYEDEEIKENYKKEENKKMITIEEAFKMLNEKSLNESKDYLDEEDLENMTDEEITEILRTIDPTKDTIEYQDENGLIYEGPWGGNEYVCVDMVGDHFYITDVPSIDRIIENVLQDRNSFLYGVTIYRKATIMEVLDNIRSEVYEYDLSAQETIKRFGNSCSDILED